MNNFLKSILIVLTLVSGVMLSQVYSNAEAVSGKDASQNIQQPVKPADVCMVNDTYMGKAQIPVQVDGKTYYGCCQGCVSRLKGDRSLRYAKDPVTGREVDKAAAFIAAKPDGTTLYFESSETASAYMAAREKK